MNRRSVLLGAAAGAATAVAGPGSAQGAYPNRSIRMIVPWPPGQATDLIGRVVAQKVSEGIGQPIVPDNKAGAGGMIGTDAAAKSAPDGYTVLMGSLGPITTAPLVQKTPYDVEKDFAPVAMFGVNAYLLTVNNNFPARTVEEFVARLRAEPGKYTYATSGAGAAAHLITLMMLSPLKVDTVHVPFQGSGPALSAVVGGQVDFAVDTLAATGPLVRQGALRGLGITLKDGSVLAPEIPPLARHPDLRGFDASAWGGFLFPAGTPQPIIERMAAECAKATASQEVKDRLAATGVDPRPLGTAEFAAYLKQQREQFREVIRANNIQVG
ncbi:tripartite tricarboxylate transporter substrate binding protein [Craurococcus roseus]|uniref:Tripartite tricarboxylate transporter substrate binding protein n=1 Tax=Craurococcus roseus TaxID=77585 RepID=A0ABN1F7F2_9PROT